ncbi:MAG: hypothetical protein EB160_04385 [Nitrososphaeria archaeon]|nr:hypothetical protein [Nitrososphaeria archaeon]
MQKKILIGFLIIIAISIPNGIVGFLKVENALIEIDSHAKTSIEDVKMMSRLDNFVTLMKYYDELHASMLSWRMQAEKRNAYS